MNGRYLVAYSVYGSCHINEFIEFSDSMIIDEEDLDIENNFVSLKDKCLFDCKEKYCEINHNVKIKILAISDLQELSFDGHYCWATRCYDGEVKMTWQQA